MQLVLSEAWAPLEGPQGALRCSFLPHPPQEGLTQTQLRNPCTYSWQLPSGRWLEALLWFPASGVFLLPCQAWFCCIHWVLSLPLMCPSPAGFEISVCLQQEERPGITSLPFPNGLPLGGPGPCPAHSLKQPQFQPPGPTTGTEPGTEEALSKVPDLNERAGPGCREM